MEVISLDSILWVFLSSLALSSIFTATRSRNNNNNNIIVFFIGTENIILYLFMPFQPFVGPWEYYYMILRQIPVESLKPNVDELLFRIALDRQLLDGYSRKQKGRPACFHTKKCATPDEVCSASTGNHMPKLVFNHR